MFIATMGSVNSSLIDVLLDKLFDHHLTTMAQNFELMGTYLAEMLLAKIYTKPLLNLK